MTIVAMRTVPNLLLTTILLFQCPLYIFFCYTFIIELKPGRYCSIINYKSKTTRTSFLNSKGAGHASQLLVPVYSIYIRFKIQISFYIISANINKWTLSKNMHHCQNGNNLFKNNSKSSQVWSASYDWQKIVHLFTSWQPRQTIQLQAATGQFQQE